MKKENYAFTNCTVIDGRKKSEPLKDAVILVKNVKDKSDKMLIPSGYQAIDMGFDRRPGIILNSGKKEDITVPAGYKKIDLEGKYVLPGLINGHAHLTGSGKQLPQEDGSKLFVDFLGSWPGEKYAFSVIKGNLANALNSGITTIRAMGEPYYYDVEVRKDIESGRFTGPRILASGKIISSTGGFGHRLNALIADSPYEGRKAVRQSVLEEVDWIKVANTSGVINERREGEIGRVQITLEELSAICDEAHRAGLMVACHSQSSAGVREALLAGVDTIEHGAELDDELVEIFKENKNSLRGYTALIPTIYPSEIILENRKSFSSIQMKNGEIAYGRSVKGFKRALAEGIKVGVGIDSGIPFVTHYDVWKELACFVKHGGITTQQAIYMGTLGTAKILGIDKDTGSIEKGKYADFMVVDKNPLEDLSALEKPSMVSVFGMLIEKPQIKESWF